jgi:DNA mismatch repair protein MutS2
MVGNVKLSVPLRDLEILSCGVDAAETVSGGVLYRSEPGSGKGELNLIGYRVGDAIPMIDRLIDRALLEGSSSLRIVHGYGTGKLKKAIREHLKGYSCVKEVCGADPRLGGEAITVVELS